MARDISIVFSAKDNYSASLTKMIQAQREMEKSGMELQKRLDTFNKTKYTLKLDLDNAKKELADAKKGLNGTEEAAKRLSQAQMSYDNITGQLKIVQKEAGAAQRELERLDSGISKSQNRAGSQGLGSLLGQSGAYQMLGNAASQAAGVFVQSAFGDNVSTLFQSALSGMSSGAAIGTMIAPGIGTAIGGAIGTAVGAATGQMQIFQNKDEAFKNVVQSRVTDALAAQDAAVQSGSQTAALRETTQIAFNTLFKDKKVAEDYLSEVQDFAAKTPFAYEDLTGLSKTLATYGYTPGEMLTGEGLADGQNPLLQIIGDAGGALGLGSDGMSMVATALGRMKSSGKASLEYINLLQERGIDAIGYLAQGMGVSNEEVYERISKNLIDGAEAAEAIARFMQADYSGSMEEQANTYQGLMSTMEDAQNNLDAAMGKGYNDARKEGIREQTEWLESAGLEDSYRLIGEFRASLENEKEKALRDAMAEAQETDEYKQAKLEGNGAEMGRILAEAQAHAQAEYEASDGYQLFAQSQKTLIENVRQDTALKDEYWNTGYEMGQEFSKGLMEARRQNSNAELGPHLTGNEIADRRILGAVDQGIISLGASYAMGPRGGSHAYGLTRVPYNGYHAVLHEGERVLTAGEARRQGAPGAGINITINGLTVREEADINRVAAQLYSEIMKAKAVMA